ncbi:chemotaxis protein CheW [Anatilimnocola sp. NA78]|uniref:chemotaxis protein CheW n=1 Tax=Anatilimnocola sp. NA78 TaxID=3415683 RepID=UPI003CE51EE9
MPTSNINQPVSGSELQFASFQVGDLLLGIDIHQVQEINRNLNLTPVPHAPDAVQGVINLRGEVVTVIDLRRVLGLPAAEFTRSTSNVIIKHTGEQVGLLVDKVAEVITCHSVDIDPLPENLGGIDSCFFSGVIKLQQHLLVVLNVTQALQSLAEPAVA